MIPAELFSLNALWSDSSQSPHLTPGVHLRWTSHPVLGLPNGPVKIEKTSLKSSWAEICTPMPLHVSEVDHGPSVSLPAAVSSGESLWCRPPIGHTGGLAMVLTVDGIAPSQIAGGHQSGSGFVPVQHGAAVSSTEIWLTSGSIDMVRIEGPGRLRAAQWYSIECLSGYRFEGLAYVGPPFENLGQYHSEPIADPAQESKNRVSDGAPQLIALEDAVTATSSTPAANSADREWDRVSTLVNGEISAQYERLLHEPDPLLRLTTTVPLESRSRPDAATVTIPVYALVMAAAIDPVLPVGQACPM